MIRFNLHLTLVIGLSFIAQSFTCSRHMQDSKASSPSSVASSYRYVDGAGNIYRISQKNQESIEFSYSPVKPKFSSSGTYDGGEPAIREMTPDQFSEIQELFIKCLETQEGALKTRPMGSGQISSSMNGSNKSIVLSRRDSRNMAIDRWLSDFKIVD